MNKKGKLASTIFLIILLLPLMGLMIMDSQLKEANNITGMVVKQTEWAPFSLGIGIIAGSIILLFAVLEVHNYTRSRKIKTRTLAEINKDIDELEKNLKQI